MNNNIYNDMSVFDAIEKIQNGSMILPDIQREYCWQLRNIEELFFSIAKEFPIGSFIMWETNGLNLNASSSSFYKFLDEARYKKKRGEMISKNVKLRRNFENKDYDVVLDGQQRLTSFYLVFKGTFRIKKIGSTGEDTDNTFFDEKELYYNLDHYVENDENVNPFAFLKEEEINDGNYFKVSSIIQYKGQERKFYQYLTDVTKNLDERVADDLTNLYKKLNKVDRDQSLIHYYTIYSNKYDDALNVFVKVNSTGVPLNKTDLLFSTLINGWEKDDKKAKERREEIEEYIVHINNTYGFDIDKDFLLRVAYVLSNDGKSILSIDEMCKISVVSKIRNNWKKIKKAISATFKTLNEIDINDGRILSYNAIIPILYYVYLGGKFKSPKSRLELKKYFAIAFAKGLFGGSSNQAIENTCKDVLSKKGKEFEINYFSSTNFSNGRTFKVDIDIINDWFKKYQKGKKTYPLLMLVSPNLDLLKEHYDQDHSHADTLFNLKNFKKHRIDSSKLNSWANKKSLLPNLSFMVYYNNRSKNSDDLDTWMTKNPDKICNLRCLPMDIDYSLKNFEQFFVLRRSMMKYILTKSFDVNPERINKGDTITINAIPKTLSHLKIGQHGKVNNISNNIANVDILDKDDNCIETIDINIENLYIVEDFNQI